MTYEDFIAHAEGTRRNNPQQRMGQAYFNALYDLNPGLANAIRGTDADPFYQDDRLHRFCDLVLTKIVR